MLIAQASQNVAVEAVITSYNSATTALENAVGEWGTEILGLVIVVALVWKLMGGIGK